MSNLHALLIGIDAYLHNRLPDGRTLTTLEGCVSDVLRVEEFLRTRRGIASDQILKLTASNVGPSSLPEPQDLWPTYKNIISALRRLTESASRGDEVYIHYSGHGDRLKTAYPELKGSHGFDEVLVPVDIGASDARYLRDIEVYSFLRARHEISISVASFSRGDIV